MTTTKDDRYELLKKYQEECLIMSKAYSMSELYYRNMYKFLTYPLIILSTVSTVFSGFKIHPIAVIMLNLSTLLLVGFNQVIDPKDKEIKAHQVAGEYGEIEANINQFVQENAKSKADCKAFSQLVLEQLTIWRSLSPPIRAKYILQCQQKYGKKIRRTASALVKKKEGEEIGPIDPLVTIIRDS